MHLEEKLLLLLDCGCGSKATHLSAVAKFALGGKKTMKKSITEMAMSYGNVYVANVSHGNMAQCVRAFVEAESFALTLAWSG